MAWTTVLLVAPAALWLWTRCRPAGMRRGPESRAPLPPPAQRMQELRGGYAADDR